MNQALAVGTKLYLFTFEKAWTVKSEVLRQITYPRSLNTRVQLINQSGKLVPTRHVLLR